MICSIMAYFTEDCPATRAVWPDFRITLLYWSQFGGTLGISGEALLLNLCDWVEEHCLVCYFMSPPCYKCRNSNVLGFCTGNCKPVD